jgi:hypothetical protein
VTDERRNAIIRLLETRDDNLPLSTRRDHSSSGFVHNAPARVSCPDCLANDRIMFGCETCKGRGHIEEHRARDPYAVEKVQPYGIDATRHERARERDAQIARLDAQTREPWKTDRDELADAQKHPYAWEIARRRMYDRHDYRALDTALELLRNFNPQLSAAVVSVYSYGLVEPSATLEAAIERGLCFIDRLMPAPIRAPGGEKHPVLQRRERRNAA